jgi:hypothetical protein
MKVKALAMDSSFFHAYSSLRNTAGALVAFAYGTPTRANMTLVFAVCLSLIGSIMHTSEVQIAFSACGVN